MRSTLKNCGEFRDKCESAGSTRARLISVNLRGLFRNGFVIVLKICLIVFGRFFKSMYVLFIVLL